MTGPPADPVMAVYSALVDADWLPPKRNGTVDDLRAALCDAGLLASGGSSEALTEARRCTVSYTDK